MPYWAPNSRFRKLVSMRRISRIKPLNLLQEVVMVGGWPVVVAKGQFSVDKLILYFEIESFLPFDDKRYELYRSSHTPAELHGQKGWVVQTVKLGGHISQGMVFSIDDVFPEVTRIKQDLMSQMGSGREIEDDLMDLDLTDDLKIKKWVTFCRPDGGIDLGEPPSFLPDTKLQRAQNLHELLEKYGDTEFQITEMLDGVPMMVYQVKEDGPEYLKLPGMLMDDRLFRKRSGTGISVGNHDYRETEESRTWAAVRHQRILEALGYHVPQLQVVLAGILHGEEISGNPHEIGGCRFYACFISDLSSMDCFTMEEAEEFRVKLDKTFQLVPTFSRRIKLSAFAEDIDDLMMKAEGSSCVFEHERQPPKRKGLVFDALDGSLSFKAVSNGWLLDETEKLREMGEDARRRPGPNDCV